MAARKTKKQASSNTATNGDAKSTEAEPAPPAQAATAATKKTAKKATKKAARKSASKVAGKKRRKPRRSQKAVARKTPVARGKTAQASPKRRGPGQRYSDAERQNILATANREGLTGVQVSKRFGVSSLTYYAWRKKSGTKRGGRTRAAAVGAVVGTTLGKAVNLAEMIRRELQPHLGRLIPEILKNEIGGVMSGFSAKRRGRRRS